MNAPTGDGRASSLILGSGLALLATATAAIAVTGLAAGWHAYAARAPTVTVATGAAAGLAASAIMALLAAMLLPARPSPRFIRATFRLVVACLPALVVLPVLLALAAPAALERRGYRACPGAASAGQRLLAQQWCRAT